MILKLHFKLTLHCDPELFLRELGLTPDATPQPIRAPRTVGLTAGQFLRATEWLHQNLSEDHDLQDLAAAVAATPERLQRAFKQTTGLTLQQYRLRARVERARQLLVDGRLPIKAVGQDSGFYDQAHLTRAFRAAYGTTPSRYRKEQARIQQPACPEAARSHA